MVDISNKALALVLVAAIVVSLSGTMVSLNKLGDVDSLTGFATSDTGTTNITIASDLSIEFEVNLANFGSGYVNDSGGTVEVCTMDTNGTDPAGDCVGFNSGISNLTLVNIGNQDADISLDWDRNESQIGGTGAAFNYSVSNNQSSSCAGTLQPVAWTTVNNITPTNICDVMQWEDSSDALNIGIRFAIPQNAPPATHTFIATATAS